MNHAERVPESEPSAPGTQAIGASSRDRGHIFIAGTGRSGTSFLVRYLTELGLDTHLSRRGKNASWDDAANAGLEDLALPSSLEDLPYVVKSPWLYQHIGELVESNAVRIELVIIPVRNLVDAATSRSIVELRAVHQAAPWMATLKETWEHWALTPGGSVFSLNPLDQARLLAVGFHILIETLVRADIPILFLEFPHLAEDGAYLFSKLRPWLPPNILEEQGLAVHRRVSDSKKIRVRQAARSLERECEAGYTVSPSPAITYDDFPVLDQFAVRRELERLRGLVSDRLAILDDLERLRAVEASFDRTIRDQQRELERLRDIEVEFQTALTTLTTTRAVLDNVHASRSWKLTRPLRRLTAAVRAFMRT